MEPLSEKQQRLYDWIIAYFKQHQVMPSIRDMMSGLDYPSPAPIQSLLVHLRSKGYIQMSNGKARSLRLVGYQIELVPISKPEQEAA